MKKVLFLIGVFDQEAARKGSSLSEVNFQMLDDIATKLDVELCMEWVMPDTSRGRIIKAKDVLMKDMREHREAVMASIRSHAPDIVMACGPLALKCLFDKGGKSVKEHLRLRLEIPDLSGIHCAATQSFEMINANHGMAIWLYLDTLAALRGNAGTKWGKYTVLLPGTPEWAKEPSWVKGKKLLGVDLETFPGLSPWHPDARIRMCVISDKAGRACIVQARKNSSFPAWLRRVIEDPSIKAGGSNIKFDYKWFKRFGYSLTNMHDTSTAEHVLDGTQPMTDLKSLTFLYLPKLGDYSRAHRALVKSRGKDRWDLVTDEEQYEYCGGDGEASIAAMLGQIKKLKKEKLELPFSLSMGVYDVLAKMEAGGACISSKVNKELDLEFEAGLGELRQELVEVLGPVNPNSPAQLVPALMKAVPGINLTKARLMRQFSDKPYKLKTDRQDSDYTTDKEALNREAHKHPIIATLLQYRRYAKLHGTYVTGLREKHMVQHPDKLWYVHTSYRTDKVKTYRLSSQGPNLQNIPRKPDPDDPNPIPLHLNIKRQFISRFKGGKIIEADLSQAEIRLAAHLSQDKQMMEAIIHGDDIHRAMTAKFLGKAESAVTDSERAQGKSTNFLVIYGGGANTLSKTLGCSKAKAQMLLDQYFATFGGLKAYMEECGDFAQEHLFSESIFGYRRRFRAPDDWNTWPGWKIRRQAWNHRVQNPAACCTFVSMIMMEERYRKEGLHSLIDMQVHDSVKTDTHPKEIEAVAEISKEYLENPDLERYGIELTVPLVADVDIGPSWGEMEKYVF